MAESEMATKFDQLVKHIDQPGIDSDPEREVQAWRHSYGSSSDSDGC
jgi:hypothetical protein